MAAGKKKKPLDFMELEPLEDEEEDEDLEELGDDEFEEVDDDELGEEELEGDLDEEGKMLAETVLGDGDMATRAQALKDFVKHCMSESDSGDY